MVRRLIPPILLLGSFIVGACAPNGNKNYIQECNIPSDQKGTIEGKWRANPVPIAFKAGDFEPDEMSDIVGAADVWNDFYKSTQDLQVLDYGGNASSPATVATPLPGAPCTGGIMQAGKFTGPVVIYKQPIWNHTDHNAIAITTYCTTPAKPHPNMFMAIMEVNYQDFFVTGKKLPDLQSIFVHEFGHLLGLDHSCDTKGKTGFPKCNDQNLPQDYYYAVMFPVILFDSLGIGEQRRDLRDNDQYRGNCLYNKDGSNGTTTSTTTGS